jgi:hypothetical protein
MSQNCEIISLKVMYVNMFRNILWLTTNVEGSDDSLTDCWGKTLILLEHLYESQ